MSETDNAKDTTSPVSQSNDKNGDEKTSNIEVHSANAWEKADLGDEERKNKFLRLMGAGKKVHHGRFVIGDHSPEHPRNKDETEQLQHKLEDQYTHSMQHRLAGGRRGHIGLGYHDDDLDAKPAEEVSDLADHKDDGDCEAGKGSELADDGKKESCDSSEGVEKEGAEDRPSRKRESTEGGSKDDGSPVEKKMKFVKASS